MDNKARVLLGDVINGKKEEDGISWKMIRITKKCWDDFLRLDPKGLKELSQKKKITSTETLRFEHVAFEKEEEYSRLEIFKKVICLHFFDCRAHPSNPDGSALNKIHEALKGVDGISRIEKLYFENARVVYMRNVNKFTTLKTLKLKQVDSFAWESHTELEPTPKLTYLSIDDVPVNETIIENISEIKTLDQLELSAVYRGNNADEVLERLGKLARLTNLKLSKMPITKQPEWVEKLPELRILELSSLRIERFAPSGNFAKLDELILDNNPLSEIEFKDFICENQKKLSIANTNITEFPNLKKLKMLDISHNHIKEIPEWFKCTAQRDLSWLNISDTKLTELSFLDSKGSRLKCLIAENLHLTHFPEKILKIEEWCLHGENYDASYIRRKFSEDKENYKRAYLRGTMARNISQHFFTGGYKCTRIEFWGHKNDTGHQATIIFLGEKGKKSKVICSLFDISTNDLIVCGDGGQTLVNTRAQLQVADTQYMLDDKGKPCNSNDKEKGLAFDTELKIWALSQGPEYRSGHGMFMPNNALYVIVIDADSALDLQRKADFWFSFVRYSVDSADILFLLLKELNNDVEAINLEKYRMDSHCHVHRELAYMTSGENDDIALDKARGILAHAIKRLPSYKGKVIVNWKHALRHISGILESQPSLSYYVSEKNDGAGKGMWKNSKFKTICDEYFLEKKPSPEMLNVFRTLLTEARVCYDDGNGNLYSLAWISCFVYATMKHAAEKHGEINIQELKMYLLDNVAQYDYFDSDIEKLLDLLSSPYVSQKNLTKKRAQICIERSKNETYLFPQFTYICGKQWGSLVDKSFEERKKQKAWKENWSKYLIKFRNSRYGNRYIIDMPLLSDGLLVDIICRLEEILRHGRNDNNHIEIAVGADGLMALWKDKPGDKISPKYFLLVDGVPSAPGRLQILVGPYIAEDEDEEANAGSYPNTPGVLELMDKEPVLKIV